MKNDISIVATRQPGSVDDPLTEIAREGARRMLATALRDGERQEGPVYVAHPAEVARRSRSLEVLLPVLYLRGISTGDSRRRSPPFSEPRLPTCRRG